MRRALVCVAILAGGCAAKVPPDGFEQVRQSTALGTGAVVQWRGHSQDDAAVDRAVTRLLGQPLTPAAAVQVALLNNQSLQASLEELGIAQADLVQAGLLKNPVFSIDARLPDRSPKRTYLDVSVEDDFIDLLLMPLRKRVAASQVEQTRAEVSEAVLQLAAATRSAFYAVQAAQQQVELRQTVLAAESAALDTASRMKAVGNENELALLDTQTADDQARLDLAAAEESAAETRERLNDQMGAWGEQTRWTIASRLADLPVAEESAGGLEALAVRRRPDLAASRAGLVTTAEQYGFVNRLGWLSEVNAGVNGERETDGQWRIGPSVQFPVPLFDQGQASRAKAATLFVQGERRYWAAAVSARVAVRSAYVRMRSARHEVEFYQREVLPTRERLMEQTQLQSNGMFIGVFQLLDARRGQVEAGRDYIEALKSYWTARSDLELAVGGGLPGA